MTTLSELMRNGVIRDDTFQVDVGEDWMQGRSVFGGLQAAVAVRAMRTLAPESPMRSLQMTFVAPVAQHMRARARVLRTGKSVTHVEARLESDAESQAVAIGVFGARRESIVRRDLPTASPAAATETASAERPAPKPARAPVKLPYVPGVVPAFMQQFDVSLLDGALPFSGKRVQRVVYELALRDHGTASEAHLLAIADFVPPVALSWMPTVVPGSSLTWMLEILDDDFITQPLSGWRIDAEMVAARDGYTSQSTTIYAPNGNAIALSRQSMVVFA